MQPIPAEGPHALTELRHGFACIESHFGLDQVPHHRIAWPADDGVFHALHVLEGTFHLGRIDFFTSDIDNSLITRKMELSDNVIPASNSSLAKGLFSLANYFYNNEFKEFSVNMLSKMKASFLSTPSYHSN